jgi:methyl-accepting chemotaxis protein
LKKKFTDVVNQKIGTKLLIMFLGLVVFSSALLTIISLFQLSGITKTVSISQEQHLPVLRNAVAIETHILQAVDYQNSYLITGDFQDKENALRAINSAGLALLDLEDINEKYTNFEIQQQLPDIAAAIESYRQSFLQVTALMEENQQQLQEMAARLALSESLTANHQIQVNIENLSEKIQENSWLAMADQQKSLAQNVRQTFLWMLAAVGVSLLAGFGLARIVSASFTGPIIEITDGLTRISKGDLLRGSSSGLKEPMNRADEIGDLTSALEKSLQYLHKLAETVNAFAVGDSAVEFKPINNRDELGNSFQKLMMALYGSMQDAKDRVLRINNFATDTQWNVTKSNQASLQTTEIIQQMTQDTSEQFTAINEAIELNSISQKSIAQIVSGSDKQQIAVEQGVSLSTTLAEAIGKTSISIAQVANESDEAAQSARSGAVTIGDTLRTMEAIQHQISALQEKMQAMQNQTGLIGNIVETIEEIAAQTNLLAINATIEAAHAESDSRVLTEGILEKFMLATCEMVARMLEMSPTVILQSYWVELGSLAGMDQILITDEDGVIVEGNEVSLFGFRFPEDDPQTAEFRTLIHQRNGRVCQPAQFRAFDKQVFKYAGVSRLDKSGIVQVGFNMKSLTKFNLQIGGFAVVAKEVYHLADSSRQATKEIRLLLNNIQNAANEAAAAVQESSVSVKAGLSEAASAGQNLDRILGAFQQVTGKTRMVANATQQMQHLSEKYLSTMHTIQMVAETNSRITEEIVQRTSDMSAALDWIISFSDKNNTATATLMSSVGEMCSQANEVTKTTKQLTEMAIGLNQIVAKFSLEA